MDYTGERVIPGGMNDFGTLLEHIDRYWWAARFAEGLRVLDVACGVGYGSTILSTAASHVVGFDNSMDAVLYASESYGSFPRTEFYVDDMLEFEQAGFDMVVCFESIEHVSETELLLGRIYEALTKDGVLLVSTPAPRRWGSLFHQAQFTPDIFEEELLGVFDHLEKWCQIGRAIWPGPWGEYVDFMLARCFK